MRYIMLFLIIFAFVSPTASASTGWIVNTDVTKGLTDIGSVSSPEVFDDSGVLKMIAGSNNQAFYGFQWNGTEWLRNDSIAAGLGNLWYYAPPTIFNDSGTFKLISGAYYGEVYGFQWNGTSWVSNSSIVAGLGDLGSKSAPTVYADNGIFKMITPGDGAQGFQWNGSAWISNPSLVAGLDSFLDDPQPFVYNDSGTLNLITGRMWGSHSTHQWNGTSWVSNSSIGTGLVDYGGRASPTVYYSDERLNLVTGETGGEMYGYIWNSPPTVASASISPTPTNETDDLTALNGSTTDADGDPITLYYKWYKDGIHQPSLNNISTVLADNTTAGEVWKVGIIPNDGYENGTEVQSATVTIDSPNLDNFTFSNLKYTSPIKEYESSTITIDINDSDGTITSAIIKIHGNNYSMQYISRDQWRYIYSDTSIITNHYITDIYATDNSSGTNSTTYATKYISVLSRAGGGGGGGTSIPTISSETDEVTMSPETDEVTQPHIEPGSIDSDDKKQTIPEEPKGIKPITFILIYIIFPILVIWYIYD